MMNTDDKQNKAVILSALPNIENPPPWLEDDGTLDEILNNEIETAIALSQCIKICESIC